MAIRQAAALVAMLAAMHTAHPAQALTISAGTQGFSVNSTSAGGGTPGQAIGFAQFNPLLGTLTDVSLAFTLGQSGAVVTASAQDAFVATAHASVGAVMQLSVGAQALLSGGYMANASCDVGIDLPFCTQTVPSLTPIAGSFEPNPTSLPGSVWAPFIGTGTVDLTAAIADLGFTSGIVTGFFGRDASTAEAFWSGQVAITYRYTAPTAEAPEPASLALLGAALGLAALARHRR